MVIFIFHIVTFLSANIFCRWFLIALSLSVTLSLYHPFAIILCSLSPSIEGQSSCHPLSILDSQSTRFTSNFVFIPYSYVVLLLPSHLQSTSPLPFAIPSTLRHCPLSLSIQSIQFMSVIQLLFSFRGSRFAAFHLPSSFISFDFPS